MKKLFCLLAIAASLPVMSQTASAQVVLFSDNFNGFTTSSGYPATASTGANFETNISGRIGGTLSLGSEPYINGPGNDGNPPPELGNEQVGDTNPADLVADPLDDGVLGDDLLLANGASDVINNDFSSVNSALVITFNGNVNSSVNTDWVAFMVGSSTATFVVSDNGGVLFRENGGTQAFNNGAVTNGATGINPGQNAWESYKVILSGSNGTGSAFNGNGSLLTYYANGVELGAETLTQLTSGEGYIGFDNTSSVAGIDDIDISTVPEPSTYALLGGGLALLAFVVLRRKQVSVS